MCVCVYVIQVWFQNRRSRKSRKKLNQENSGEESEELVSSAQPLYQHLNQPGEINNLAEQAGGLYIAQPMLAPSLPSSSSSIGATSVDFIEVMPLN